MTGKFKKYKSGKRTYTHFDGKIERVEIASKKQLQKQLPKPLETTIDPEIVNGKLANAFAVSHSPEEFYIDFFKQTGNKAKLVSRIILSPKTIKKLLKLLIDK